MIECEGISRVYPGPEGALWALRNVHLTVKTGEFVAVVGHSGSGKSTLMQILGCLDTPTEGRYRLCGQDAVCGSPTERAALRRAYVGFVFQNFQLLSGSTALQNVALPLQFRGVKPARRREMAAAALESVGLGSRMYHRPGELSGGQQQRVAVARALVTNPPLILADEPTGNLDPESSRQVLRLLEDVHRMGKTVVLITHDPALAVRAGRQIRLENGQIV